MGYGRNTSRIPCRRALGYPRIYWRYNKTGGGDMPERDVESLFEIDEVYTWTRGEKMQVMVVRKCTFCAPDATGRTCIEGQDKMLVDVQTKEVYPECMFRNGEFKMDGLRRADAETVGKLIIDNV